jgi:hypothetical protein
MQRIHFAGMREPVFAWARHLFGLLIAADQQQPDPTDFAATTGYDDDKPSQYQ